MKKPVFVKLEDLSWGIHLDKEEAIIGAAIEMTNRAGEVSIVLICEIVFSTNTTSYCRIMRQDKVA